MRDAALVLRGTELGAGVGGEDGADGHGGEHLDARSLGSLEGLVLLSLEMEGGRGRRQNLCFWCTGVFHIFSGVDPPAIRSPPARSGMMARAFNAIRSKIVPFILEILAFGGGYRRGAATSAYR